MVAKTTCWPRTPRRRPVPTRSERSAASSGRTNLRRTKKAPEERRQHDTSQQRGGIAWSLHGGDHPHQEPPKETSMIRRLLLTFAGALVALAALGIPQMLRANDNGRDHDDDRDD